MPSLRKIAVYSRKSKFTGKGESIQNQMEMCQQYIAAHFPCVPEQEILLFEDEGFSGKNTNRPQFQAMMRMVRKCQLSAVVCYRLDRISRNIGDFAKLIEEFSATQTTFVSIKEQFDTGSPMGKAMMYIASVFSQLERETIAERIRDNMLELAKTGRWLGGVTPTGYQSAAIDTKTANQKKKRAFALVPVEEEARLVKTIYALFLRLGSLTGVQQVLAQMGALTKNQKPFSRFAIRDILKNPVYLVADQQAYQYFTRQGVEVYSPPSCFNGNFGVMAYNKTAQSSQVHARAMQEWIVAVGRHQGLISSSDWIAAQQLLEQNSGKTGRRVRSNTALLPGLLCCQACKGYMRPKMRPNGTFSYLCQNKEASKGALCQSANANGAQLDHLVQEQLGNLPENKTLFYQLLKKELQKMQQNTPQPQKLLQKRLLEIQKELHTLTLSLKEAQNSPARQYILQHICALHEEKTACQQALQPVNAPVFSGGLPQLIATLTSFEKLLGSLSLKNRRQICRQFVKAVQWDGQNACILLKPADKIHSRPLCEDCK